MCFPQVVSSTFDATFPIHTLILLPLKASRFSGLLKPGYEEVSYIVDDIFGDIPVEICSQWSKDGI